MQGSTQILTWVVRLVIAAAFAVLRLEMNEEFSGARWKALVAFEAPLPFGHRVLVPSLAAPVFAWGVPLRQIWLVTETLATTALLVGLEHAGKAWLPPRVARLAAIAFVLAAAYPFLLDHKWAVFYPWDTPAMAFVAFGLAAVAYERHALAVLIAGLGAFNRETALLVPALTVALALGASDRERRLAWAGLMFAAFVAARLVIALALPDNPGPPLDVRVEGTWRVLHNLAWLSRPSHLLAWLGSVAFVPVLATVAWRWIPPTPRRLLLLAFAGAIGLAFVGNVYEPRVYGETLVLAWLPLSLGAWQWLQQSRPVDDRARWLQWFDRAGTSLLALAAVAVVLWLSTHP